MQNVPQPYRVDVRPRAWIYPLAVAVVLIIVLLTIKPCTRCQNRKDKSETSSASRWIEWGISSSEIDKKAAIEKKMRALRARRISATKKEQKDSAIIKPVEENKVVDFGTKLELIPPPSTR